MDRRGRMQGPILLILFVLFKSNTPFRALPGGFRDAADA
jgi:hypothetical protein